MTRLNKLLAVAGLLALVLTARLGAQDPSAQARSLKLVPADAATYNVLLRNGEQIDAIAKSKAWARLNAIPFVKMAWEKFDEEWKGGSLTGVRQWYEQPANTELVRLAKDLIADEVFIYGARNSADFLNLVQMIFAANQQASLVAALRGDPAGANDPIHQAKLVLKVLSDNADQIKIPDIVIGFRTKDAQAVNNQVKRLEELTKALPPELKNIVQTKQIGDATFRLLQVSGAMIPWNMVPIGNLEEQPGDLDKLVKRIKEMTLTVAVGVRDDFLLVSLGEGTAGIEALGKGRPLADVAELKPVAKYADRKLTTISYISKEYQSAVTPGKQELDDTGAWLLDVAKNAGLSEELQRKLKKDLKELSKDLQRFIPEPGAYLFFSFLSGRGAESFAYDWTKNHGLDATKPLTLLEHMGGDPLFFTLSRHKHDPKDYEITVKWLKIAYGYLEEALLPQVPMEFREPYEQFMRAAKPHLVRLDTATGKMLLPALADGQTGFVLDSKLKNKQWHAFMPPSEKDLPFPELAVVLGVSDVELLKKAFKEYRTAVNGIMDAFSQIAPIGQIEIPEPDHQMIKGGDLYTYPLPILLGLEARIAPSAGLSKNVAAFTLSKDHATRLLAKTPLRLKGGPLANAKRPLAGATHIDVAGMIGVLAAWGEYGLGFTGAGNDVVEQVLAVTEILKVFRSYTSATYIENGVVVTHGETIIRDLEK